jgi:hypothetical protein
VVVHDLDIEGFVAAIGPFEAHTPLIVDANAVLSVTISLELLKTIARRLSEIHETCRLFKSVQSDLGSAGGNASESSGIFAISELPGITVPKPGWQATLLAGVRSADFTD